MAPFGWAGAAGLEVLGPSRSRMLYSQSSASPIPSHDQPSKPNTLNVML